MNQHNRSDDDRIEAEQSALLAALRGDAPVPRLNHAPRSGDTLDDFHPPGGRWGDPAELDAYLDEGGDPNDAAAFGRYLAKVRDDDAER